MKNLSVTVAQDESGMLLVDFVAQRLDLSRRKARGILDRRGVFVNQRRVWMARHPLCEGDRVEIRGLERPPEDRVVPLLHRDDSVLVADKPPGILSAGAGSVEALLREQLDMPSLLAVHRLDRDTSGCLILAANARIKTAMEAQFREHSIEKTYRALVAGRMAGATKRISRALEGRSAVTDLRVLDANARASLVSVRIATGRTHQIRKHLAGIRHPVLGDRTYLTGRQRDAQLRDLPRQMLHALRIAFRHPVTQEPLRIEAPLPADFRGAMQRLGLG